MVQNSERADWAQDALEAFASSCMPGEITEETVTDLICDIGHFARRKLGLNEDAVLRIYEFGIGAWIAEERHPEGDPWNNAAVQVLFKLVD
jgi:hypothetical protein